MILFFDRFSRDVPKFLRSESPEIQQYLTPIFYSEVISAVFSFLSFDYCREAIESSNLLQLLCSVEVGSRTVEALDGTEFCTTGVALQPLEKVDVSQFIEDFSLQVILKAVII